MPKRTFLEDLFLEGGGEIGLRAWPGGEWAGRMIYTVSECASSTTNNQLARSVNTLIVYNSTLVSRYMYCNNITNMWIIQRLM